MHYTQSCKPFSDPLSSSAIKSIRSPNQAKIVRRFELQELAADFSRRKTSSGIDYYNERDEDDLSINASPQSELQETCARCLAQTSRRKIRNRREMDQQSLTQQQQVLQSSPRNCAYNTDWDADSSASSVRTALSCPRKGSLYRALRRKGIPSDIALRRQALYDRLQITIPSAP